MNVIYCPECKAPLKVVYSKQGFTDWKVCDKCDHPSLVVAPEEGAPKVMSLRAMLDQLRADSKPKDKYGAIGILEYILKKGGAEMRDLTFYVGKEVGTGIEYYKKRGIILGDGPYEINPKLKRYVIEEIRKYIPKEDFLSVLD